MSFSREFLSEIYRWTQNAEKVRAEIKKQVNVKNVVRVRAAKVRVRVVKPVVSAAVKVAKEDEASLLIDKTLGGKRQRISK